MKINNINKVFLICFILLNASQLIECKDIKEFSNLNNSTNVVDTNVKVSIIIPVYNSSKFIRRSLESAFNQTLNEIEIIVVDDHSTDDTLNIVKTYENDKRLKIISLKKNKGVGNARNIGINSAIGEFIGFIDSDDYVDENFFEYLYKYSNEKDLVNDIYVNSTNLSNKIFHRKKSVFTHGGVCDSIWRREFINKHHIRFPTNRKVGEDIIFRKKFLEENPKIVKVQDNGIYYYFKAKSIERWSKKGKSGKSMSRKIVKVENKKTYNKITYFIDKFFVPFIFIVVMVSLVLYSVIILSLFLYRRSKYLKLIKSYNEIYI